MAEITAGVYRFARKDPTNNYLGMTPVVTYNVLDSDTAPRAFFDDSLHGNRPTGGTTDINLPIDPAIMTVNGSAGEFLDLEYQDVASTHTFTTTLFTVRLQVWDSFPSGSGRIVVPKAINLVDRTTKTVSGTFQHPFGLDDNPAFVQYAWNPVLRFIPPIGHKYLLFGQQLFKSSGT